MLSEVLLPFRNFLEDLSSFQLLVTGALLLCAAAFLLALTRGRRVALQHTTTTEDWALQLTRIAIALERIADRPAERVIVEAQRKNEVQEVTLPPPEPRESSIVNSMFGR